MLKKIVTYIFDRCVSASMLEKKMNKFNVERCKDQVSTNEATEFNKSSRVYNPSKTKENIVIGRATYMYGELLVFGYGGKITLGDYSFVGENTKIWSGESVSIGDHVFISHNCNIFDTNSHELDYVERQSSHLYRLENGLTTNIKGNVETAPIIIEDHVWISFNVIILKGVTIGKGAIIAAGSVVTKNVAPFTLMAGNPAKPVKSLIP
jgi:acetyltransferase-like isoleucine patch superfamily enzyme